MKAYGNKIRGLTVAVLMVFSGISSAFEIYGFIPYTSKVVGNEIVSGRPSDNWFRNLGIKPIKLVYEDRLLDRPDNSTGNSNAVINVDKVTRIAKESGQSRDVMVSLDLESWNRFSSETPSRYLKVLQIFREANPDAIVGFYSTVPQNTYVWREEKRGHYDGQNEKYATVADAVDYFSPSLYNYSLNDFESWKKGAEYNIEAAKKYSRTKKIFPFITPEVEDNGRSRWLSYDEMMSRLKLLKSLGADGCVLWASSRSRDSSGKRPVLDPKAGWLKAVVDFGRVQSATQH
ncbi:hypothetical protein [Pseudomonas sp. NMI542_15]|uniref:hypothetical protein n=1 Tax=Pseudomonas sp. NMI542_15 TaxID=2903148 RepID=UPI001E53EE79|nr:hypothetical protein [Pseudomonas sp. NMI542_15]MCE0780833.1 hypothetical protein [Pseudomonas sp. NMI542_15]